MGNLQSKRQILALTALGLGRWLLLATMALMPALAGAVEEDSGTSLESSVQRLTANSFREKETVVTALEGIEDPRVLTVMRAMLEGNLYYRKSDQRIVVAEENEEGDYRISDVVTGEQLGVIGKRKLKKISTNNKLRKQLRQAIARLSLVSESADVRLAAVRELTEGVTPESAELLRAAFEREKDADVREMLGTALAMVDINSPDKPVRLKAIVVLGDSLNPEASDRLAALLEQTEDGSYLEPDRDIRKAVTKALKRIDSRRSFYGFLETLFFGLSLGSVLLLIAIGLAITFGVMGVINMAHGELMMLGAYTTYFIQLALPNHIEYSLFLAVPAAFVVSGLFGIAIERGVIRYLYGRPLETLLATFGISLLLQQLVRTYSSQNVAVANPDWMSGSFAINPAWSLTYSRVYIIAFSLLVFLGLLLILKKTTLGLKVRAVAQNRAMARAMGIRTEWVDALTFGLGSGIAGVAGVALSQLTNVGPNLGQTYIIDSFMVVVFGGVGNLWGTFVGALSLGVVNKFLEPWTGAVLAKILVLVFIILFIQKRPRGLFPQKGRAAEG